MKINMPLQGKYDYRIQERKITKNWRNGEREEIKEFPKIYLGRDLVTFGKLIKNNKIDKTNYKLPSGCEPDEFQIEAGEHIEEGKNILVDAPTGTGKTAIAHYAIGKNIKDGKKTIYTTPLKALSNQKLSEFRKIYGEENVGILTGDRRENVEAPIMIMTTEVYRNMALSNVYGDTVGLMQNVGSVIFDEFHYLGDMSRGSNWEESIILAPKDVQIIALSATIGNPEKIVSWFNDLKERKAERVTLPSEKRYVPLKYDTIKTASYYEFLRRIKRAKQQTREEEISKKPTLSDYNKAVKKLDGKDQLPAIFFVFSKRFSRELIDYLGENGEDLTTPKEKREILEIVNKYKEKTYIGSGININALEKGYAVHNAGIMPEQKALIEELFNKKLLKVVVATETLAAGINMPAKTVVISKPYKPSEREENEKLTVNEFNQMAGRAGRRGIDEVGYVYAMISDIETERIFQELNTSPSDAIESRFNPDYPFIAGYYEYNEDNERLKELFDKSFYVKTEKGKSEEQKRNLIEESDKKTQVMLQKNFLRRENGKINTTKKGEMASVVRGYESIPLVELIESRILEGAAPETIAFVMSAIANPAEAREENLNFEDIIPIYYRTHSCVNKIYEIQRSNLEIKLKGLGKSINDFSSYEEILQWVNDINTSEAESEEIKAKVKDRGERIKKLRIITSKNENYSPNELKKAFERGSSIPTIVLEKYLRIIEEYKQKNKVDDIKKIIEKLENEIKNQEVIIKGSKTQAKAIKKKQILEEKIKKAEVMEYLDERVFREIGDNYAYIKNNPQKRLEKEYRESRIMYEKINAGKVISKIIESLKSIETYKDPGIYMEDEMIYEVSKAGYSIDTLRSNIEKMNGIEKKVGISREKMRLGNEAAKNMIKWAYLNRISTDSVENWKYLMRSRDDMSIDEGSIYRMIIQTNDILGQVTDIANIGEKKSDNEADREYYRKLRDGAEKAKELIIREPVVVG